MEEEIDKITQTNELIHSSATPDREKILRNCSLAGKTNNTFNQTRDPPKTAADKHLE